MVMTDPLDRDAPGDMRFGENVVVKTIRPENYGVTVTYGVFGSYVEAHVKHPPETEGGRDMRVHVDMNRSERNLGKSQRRFMRGLTVVVAGTALGWFDQ